MRENFNIDDLFSITECGALISIQNFSILRINDFRLLKF